MNQRIFPVARVLGILALSAVTIFGLHQLGKGPWLSVDWSHLGQWLDTTPPIEALLSTARVVGLGCGWWIVLSTSFYLAAGLCKARAALRLVTPITLPFIRTLTARVVLGTVTVSSLGNAIPAIASDRPLVTGQLDSYPTPLAVPHSPPLESIPQTPGLDHFFFPLPSLKASAAPHPQFEVEQKANERKSVHPFLSQARPIKPGDHYRIMPGDHMWNIARRALTGAMPHPPTTQQIVSYWVDLIEANRESIRSGNPDLIYPDEQILLPHVRKA